MAASLDEILTAAKNIVTAINNASRQYLIIAGAQIYEKITAPTLVVTGHGRLCVVSVYTAGTTVGMAYDATVTTDTTKPLCSIPMAVGVYRIDLPFDFGLVIVPGTGHGITVSYSAGIGAGGV